MNDEHIVSPAKKRFKQLTVMESFSKGVMDVSLNSVSRDHCAVVIEPEPLDGCFESSSSEVLAEGVPVATVATVSETFTLTETSLIASVIEGTQKPPWKGKPLADMCSLLNLSQDELVEVVPGRNHVVLFKVPILPDSLPLPHPSKYEDKWDSEHVKLPCSPSNLYPVNSNGNASLEQRWSLITTAYLVAVNSSIELEKAILTYNSRYNQIWDFKGFHNFIGKILSREESQRFFRHTLPGIIDLAIGIPKRITRPPVLLVRQKAQSLSMSQSQIASLLANAFLNTFPRRNTQKKQSEFSTYPDINFIKLFENKSNAIHVYEKLKCLLHYFDRVIEKEPTGTLTFTRQVVNEADFPNWDVAQETLRDLYISSEGTIEKEGHGLLQMDFANRFIGGGVLNWGCVQEEIRFVICPELIASCLFTEAMESNEALVITGCEQYSRYSGYSETFRYEGDYLDTTPRDAYGRRLCQVVAVDAVPFRRSETQYQRRFLLRELNKVYTGFYSPRQDVSRIAVATGNWGCGAFQGDPRLKCLIQLMAAALTGRDVAYFTFGDQQLSDDIFSMYSLIKEKNVTVGTLFTLLCQYGEQFGDSQKPSLDLYGYLYAVLDSIGDSDGGADSSDL